MTAASNSSTSVSRRAWAWAAAVVLAANAWVGLRLDPLLRESYAVDLRELDARIDAFGPAAARVKLLVFGNSHAQHALRPPSLGPALGLAPDEAFSLTLPAATPFEMGLLAARYLPRFPAARAALVGLDETEMTQDPAAADARLRYLTRFDPLARVRYARSLPTLDQAVAAIAAAPFPAFDFGPALREGWAADRAQVAARLVCGDVGWADYANIQKEAALRPYRWGYPPVLDDAPPAGAVPAHVRRLQGRPGRLARAGRFFARPDLRAARFTEFEATCRLLEARGLRVALVATPYAATLDETLDHDFAAERAADRAMRAAYLQANGRRLYAAEAPLPLTAFFDWDHLNVSGARTFAQSLARSLSWAAIAEGRR